MPGSETRDCRHAWRGGERQQGGRGAGRRHGHDAGPADRPTHRAGRKPADLPPPTTTRRRGMPVKFSSKLTQAGGSKACRVVRARALVPERGASVITEHVRITSPGRPGAGDLERRIRGRTPESRASAQVNIRRVLRRMGLGVGRGQRNQWDDAELRRLTPRVKAEPSRRKGSLLSKSRDRFMSALPRRHQRQHANEGRWRKTGEPGP